MPVELCAIHKSDVPVLTEMMFAAYKDDNISHLMYNNNATPSIKAFVQQEYEKSWGQRPEERRIGVRDTETGELIASSQWFFFPQREGDDWKIVPVREWPDGYNKDGCNHLQAVHTAKRHEIMGPKPYIFLSTCITFPTHQRRGAGALMVQWGIEQARALNLPIFLTASPKGFPLYRKFNFEVVGHCWIDLSSFTTETHDSVAMLLREPFPSQPPKPIPMLKPDEDMPIDAAAPIPAAPQLAVAGIDTKYDVVLAPVTDPADFDRLAEVEDLAFAHDKLIQLLFPAGHGGPTLTERGDSHRKSQKEDLSNYYVKATSVATGEIVAWLKYHLFEDLEREHIPYPKELPPGANVPLMEAGFGTLKALREGKMAGKQYGFVLILVTVPEWHRRGVGRKLLQRYMDVVDEKGWESWIDASPAGMGLYQKLGWEQVGGVTVDLGQYGGEKGYMETTVSMVRKPKGVATV
ncbi:hypothetical protein MMC11_003387 [Xylographa trunciseda]|nr:hypothetical protein [Xylographa trunciseda]